MKSKETAWVNEPLKEEDYFEIKEGVFVIPYEKICDKLDRLDSEWSCKNFVHFYTMLNNNESISASCEIVVNGRTLSGACTYPLVFFRELNNLAAFGGSVNEHYSASAKSLCIVNACKPLGVQFGRDLNKKENINVVTTETLQVDNFTEKYEAIQHTILMSNNRQMAQKFLDKSDLKWNEKLQALVNQKPSSVLKDLITKK